MVQEKVAMSQGLKDTTKGYPLPSGATLHLQRPSFGAASRLRNAIAKAIGDKPLSPEEMKLQFVELKSNPSQGGALLSRILSLVSSESVEECIFDCLEQSSYHPKGTPEVTRIKIDKDLFDHEKFGDDARADFYPISYRAAEVALKPFFLPLASALKASLPKPAGSPESPSA